MARAKRPEEPLQDFRTPTPPDPPEPKVPFWGEGSFWRWYCLDMPFGFITFVAVALIVLLGAVERDNHLQEAENKQWCCQKPFKEVKQSYSMHCTQEDANGKCIRKSQERDFIVQCSDWRRDPEHVSRHGVNICIKADTIDIDE